MLFLSYFAGPVLWQRLRDFVEVGVAGRRCCAIARTCAAAAGAAERVVSQLLSA